MKSVKVKAYAKVNFTLDITGVENGYHNIKSLVSSVKLADDIRVCKRKDDKILLHSNGYNLDCNSEENNATKSAKLFKETFNTCGVDIYLNKKIPVGGGLGGSSADIAGVLTAMKKLFNIDNDVKPLADSLGSDSGYMLTGGYAVISGRGEKVERIDFKGRYYLLLLLANGEVKSKEAFDIYDGLKVKRSDTDSAVKTLGKQEFYKHTGNALYPASARILPQIKQNLQALSEYAPANMTGSGSSVYAVFSDRKSRNKVYKKLKPKYKDKLIKTQTL